MKKGNEQVKEKTAKVLFCIAAVFSIFSVFAIIFYILYASIPAFREIGVFNFLFGTVWAPTKDFLDVSKRFGILPMMVSTLAVTITSVLLGGLAGVFIAIFMVYFCPKKLKSTFNHIINLLAGIPSIIYGFFGLVVIVPVLSNISPNGSGKGILAVTIILGMMILPTVASISKDSLEAVPKSYYEGALALGATKEQAVFKVMLRSSKSGIITAIVLGAGRVIGETMAVMMIAGNNIMFPTGLFESIRTLTANIITEMSYAEGLHRQALIATGFVLLVFVLILNIVLTVFKDKKFKGKKERKPVTEQSEENIDIIYYNKNLNAKILKVLSIVISSVIGLFLLFLIGFILVKGIPHITADLLFGKSGNDKMTLAPAFLSTGMLILLSLLIALPIGIGAAIYLVEYSKKGSKFVKVIRLFTDMLAGIPSIVFGLFGMIFFSNILGFGTSLLSGSLTLVLIILPTIIRSTEESLMAVPDALREGSFALGASKVRTIFKIVLPCALKGILTSIILSIGRIVGESAALIYTAGAVPYMPNGYLSEGSSFTVMMWMFASEGIYINSAYATASVLLIIVAVLNVLVALCGRKKKEV